MSGKEVPVTWNYDSNHVIGKARIVKDGLVCEITDSEFIKFLTKDLYKGLSSIGYISEGTNNGNKAEDL